MEVDFNQVRAAVHDDTTAKILREKWQLDDRHSANGEVTCSRTDIENMLKNGQLEPVLSVEQFMSISRGKAYGNTPMPSQVRTPTASHDQPAADGTNWAGHPDWQEYQSLSDPMKAAVRNDFRCFLFVKRRGELANLAQTVGKRIESGLAMQAAADERAAREYAVENAPLLEAERFAAALQWAKGKKSYGLQDRKVR